MKSYDRNFYDLLTQVGQTYIIPSFQRDYAWDIPQWRALWDDIDYLIKNPKKYHYTGSLVYIPSHEHSTYLREVIDGQQRLTTVSIIYLAIYDLLKEGKLDDYNPEHLRVQVLANQYGVEKERLKLKPAGSDGEVYEKIFDARQDELTSVEKESNVYRCYRYYLEKLEASKTSVEELIGAATRLQVIEIVLNQDDDHPQKVFESINSTGKKLTVDDLIRNYVLMRGDYNERERVYRQYWVKIENSLKKDNESLLEEFFTTFIKLKFQKDVTKALLYESFKNLYDSETDVDSFLNEIQTYAGIYEFIKYNRGIYTEQLRRLRYYFDVLNFLKIDVLNTFLLPVLRDYINGEVSEDSAADIHSFIVNYLSRRLLAGRNTTSINKYAPGLYAKLKKYESNSLEDVLIYEFTSNVPAQISYPSDQEVEQGLRNQDFYSRKDNCRYVLLALDNANRDNQHKNLLKDGSLSIEHVMPQTLSPAWKKSLGSNYSETYDQYINNLANLTLTAYNSTYSNKPFDEKLHNPEKTGLAESPLLINQYFKQTTEWNEQTLKQRQDELVNGLLRVFPLKKPKQDYTSKLDKDFVAINEVGDTTGKALEAYMLYEQLYPVETWKELYVNFLETMSDLSGWEAVVDTIQSLKTPSPLISKDESELSNPARLQSGYFLECRKSSHDIVSTISKFIAEFNDIDYQDLKLKICSND